jgi:hypothetical protein
MRALPLLSLALVLGGCASDLALRPIMRDMGRDTGVIAEALAREDYALLERAAQRIASHPQPPVEERARIITWLGARAARFRGYDQQANAQAEVLAAAARAGDGKAALEAFHRMQAACMGCHAEFREPLLKQFYPARGAGPSS